MGAQEISVQLGEQVLRFVYCHKHACDAIDVVRTVGPEKELNQKQLFHIYRIGEDSSRYGEPVACHGQKNHRYARPSKVWGRL